MYRRAPQTLPGGREAGAAVRFAPIGEFFAWFGEDSEERKSGDGVWRARRGSRTAASSCNATVRGVFLMEPAARRDAKRVQPAD